jgi:hypothetical protein
MNVTKRIFTAGVAALALGGMAATAAATAASAAPAASTAAAKRLPVLYAAMGSAWYNNGVRPSYIALGALWTVRKMSWRRWNGSSAYGGGKEVAGVSEAGPVYRWWVRITLTDVKYHNGRPYYSKMKMVGNPPTNQVSDVQHLVMRHGYMVQT